MKPLSKVYPCLFKWRACQRKYLVTAMLTLVAHTFHNPVEFRIVLAFRATFQTAEPYLKNLVSTGFVIWIILS